MHFLKSFAVTCMLTCCLACNNNNKDHHDQSTDTTTTTSSSTANVTTAIEQSRPVNMPANIIIRAIAKGDLNKDNLADSVIVTVDTAADTESVTLKVFFATNNGYTLAVTTDKAVTPLRINGKDGYADGNDFDTATIFNGVLSISEQQLRGHTECKFRYQDGHFELIGYTSGGADAGTIYTTDYNLMTGQLKYEEVKQETDKTIKKRDVRVKLPQRPKLEDYQPGETEVKSGDVDVFL